jgi:hypothetical protein
MLRQCYREAGTPMKRVTSSLVKHWQSTLPPCRIERRMVGWALVLLWNMPSSAHSNLLGTPLLNRYNTRTLWLHNSSATLIPLQIHSNTTVTLLHHCNTRQHHSNTTVTPLCRDLHDQRGRPHPAHPPCDGIVTVISQHTCQQLGKGNNTINQNW